MVVGKLKFKGSLSAVVMTNSKGYNPDSYREAEGKILLFLTI